MRFAEAVVLWALAGAPLLAFLMVHSIRRRRRALKALAEPALLGRIVTMVGAEWRLLKAVLACAAVVLLVIGLARPQWGMNLDPVVRRGVDLVIAFDVSESMMVEDLRPSRLAKAQREAGRLLEELGGDRVAVVAFAGSAARLCPLTLDHAAARLFIDALSPDLLSAAGTSMATGLEEVIAAYGEGERRFRAAVLFSDGEDHTGELEEVIARAAEEGIVIHTVGVGTPTGGPIPVRDQHGAVLGYKEDREDHVVTSRLEEPALAAIAEGTGGLYLPATPGGGEIERIAGAIGEMDQREMQQRLLTRFEERFQIPLALALALLVLEALLPDRRRRSGRRFPAGSAPAGLLVLAMTLAPAYAASAASLMEEGNRLFEEGRYDEALKLYTEAQIEAPDAPETHLSIGNVLFRKGEHAKAREAYRRALAARDRSLAGSAHYNSGTASFAEGDLPEAVSRFREALRIDPEDADARRNLELALLKLQQLQPPPTAQQQPQDRQDQQEQEEQQSSARQQAGEEEQEQQQTGAGQEDEERKGEDRQESSPPRTPAERKERREAERILDALKGEDRPRIDPRHQRRPERPPEKDW